MTRIVKTGRIVGWFEKDLAVLRRHPRVKLQAKRSGLQALTYPLPGDPLLWSFPQPLHPIEAIASMRGFGGNEHTPVAVRALGGCRASSWADYTATMALYLFTTTESLRLIWHLLTPLRLPVYGRPKEDAVDETTRLWKAAGFGENDWLMAHSAWGDGPSRPQFWTEECAGDVEL